MICALNKEWNERKSVDVNMQCQNQRHSQKTETKDNPKTTREATSTNNVPQTFLEPATAPRFALTQCSLAASCFASSTSCSKFASISGSVAPRVMAVSYDAIAFSRWPLS